MATTLPETEVVLNLRIKFSDPSVRVSLEIFLVIVPEPLDTVTLPVK